MPPHQPIDSRIHHAVLSTIVDRGAAPQPDELVARLGVAIADVEASLQRLAENHGLILHPGSHEIWVIHPFSLSPTSVWVAAGERGFWAPCLWCAFGIQALIDDDVTIHCRLGGEATELRIEVPRTGEVASDLVAHFPLPPARAWDNCHHFCAMLLPFRSASAIDAWCQRHRLPRGEVVALDQLQRFARRWYGRHLAVDWVKWTPAEAAAIFDEAGFRGPFWSIIQTGDRY